MWHTAFFCIAGFNFGLLVVSAVSLSYHYDPALTPNTVINYALVLINGSLGMFWTGLGLKALQDS